MEKPTALRLEVRLPQGVRLNETISLQFRVTNPAPASIHGLQMNVTSTLEFLSHADFEFDVAPSGPVESSIRLAAKHPGEHEVVFRLLGPEGRELEGRLPFTVQGPTHATQVINYTDARQIQGRVVVGTEGGRLDAGGLQLGQDFRTAEFVEVLLKPPARLRAIVAKRLHGVHQRAAWNRLSLEIRAGDSVQNVGLLAGREFVLGRKRGDNDIVLRVMPPTPENETRTARISRQHARLRFEPEGLTWNNLDCGQGTFVASTLVPSRESFRVVQGATISPGRQLALCFDLAHGVSTGDQSAYSRFAQQLGVDPPAPPVGPVNAARIRRGDALQGREVYLVFQDRISLGNSAACLIQMAHPTVAAVHAQILWFGGSFWLEPLQNVHPTIVDAQQLRPHQLAQLGPNSHLQFGDVQIGVLPFRQLGVDFVSG